MKQAEERYIHLQNSNKGSDNEVQDKVVLIKPAHLMSDDYYDEQHDDYYDEQYDEYYHDELDDEPDDIEACEEAGYDVIDEHHRHDDHLKKCATWPSFS